MAIQNNGTLWGWGNNAQGQIGNGTITSYSSPIQVGTLTNWKQVATGQTWTAAIKTDGTLWVWGSNPNGELGLGVATTISYSSPVQVGALTNWKQISTGQISAGAIKTDGTLWTWGAVQSNATGTSTVGYYSSPVQVGSLTNWKSIATTLGLGGPFAAITYTELST